MGKTKPILEAAGVLAITALALAGLEIVVRVAGLSPPRIYFPEVFSLERPGEHGLPATLVKTDGAGNPFRATIDSLGFRTTGQPVTRPDTTVLFLGDSFTYGILDDEKTFPYQFQDRVRARDWRVHNAGVPGYTLEDELGYLEEKGLSTRPDILVLSFCKNDFSDYAPFWRESFKRAGAGAWRRQTFRIFLKKNVHLLSLAVRIRVALAKQQIQSSEVRNPAFDLNREEIERSRLDAGQLAAFRGRYAEDFRRLVGLCRAKHLRLVAVVFPNAAQLRGMEGLEDQVFLDSLFRSHGIAALDLYPLLKPHPVDSVFIQGDGHPTGWTNAMAAEELLKLLDL